MPKWFTREAGSARVLSHRLKNGFAPDDTSKCTLY